MSDVERRGLLPPRRRERPLLVAHAAARRGSTPYVSRHGFGYSVFEHTEDGIVSELWVYVATGCAGQVRPCSRCAITPAGPADFPLTGYWEWVLGRSAPEIAHARGHRDRPRERRALRAQPLQHGVRRPGRFLRSRTSATRTVTGDRTEFLGRNGTLAQPGGPEPRATFRQGGSRLWIPVPPCRVPLSSPTGRSAKSSSPLVRRETPTTPRNLLKRFRGSPAARGALEAVWQYWSHTLGAVHVETPDPAVNVLANGWLAVPDPGLPHVGAQRLLPVGGAFGFRDQLQDAMALVHAEPHLAARASAPVRGASVPRGRRAALVASALGAGRAHALFRRLSLAAVGDVPLCRAAPGDTGVLDEPRPVPRRPPLQRREESYYDLPRQSDDAASLYEHCIRAILHGLRFGDHGLPLMGSGDWNDGMNLVGEHGKGESVWLAFFLYDVLDAVRRRCRGGAATSSFADALPGGSGALRGNIEQNGWDGEWYRRAYFDDGSPLGSASNPECQIDSISQSWSVLSGAGDAERSRLAMEALDRRLVRRDAALIQLLDPPFDKSPLNPGYIKGYVPGVRENGGQYTHAAIWTVMAFARLGDSRRAWELFAMINPVNHARSPEAMATYTVEPYVVAADVYARSPHTGRGGWTWYTGSAGWMYRLIMESLLGLRLEVDKLWLAPCLPAAWQAFTVHYRYRETVYHLTVRQTAAAHGERRVTVDGVEQPDQAIPLVDDRGEHMVEVSIPAIRG